MAWRWTMNPDKITHNRFKNLFHTFALLTVMASMMGAAGWIFAGKTGLAVLSGLTLAGLLFSPKLPSSYIMKLYRARPVAPYEMPGLYQMLKQIARNAKLPRIPRIYYSPSPVLNAFAAGSKEDPAICLTRGLLNSLSTEQLAGIFGHEIAHIKNNDTWVMSVADIFNRSTRFLSSAALFMVLFFLPFSLAGMMDISLSTLFLLSVAPSLSTLLWLRLSRTREFEADLGSALYVGSPYPLASALHHLEKRQKRPWHTFLPANPARPPEWLSSHPDTSERIRRLLDLMPDQDNKRTTWLPAPY